MMKIFYKFKVNTCQGKNMWEDFWFHYENIWMNTETASNIYMPIGNKEVKS